MVYANDQTFGSVQRKFSVLNRELVVEDAMGSERYRIQGPLFRPWTFYILRGEERVGKITKKWSGFVKEALTSADNFAIEFPHDASPEDRAILFGAVFLIDFAYFENDR
ncbi:MAG: hypothetical protein KDD44_06090 [Bdellovibrionales bacterium]|nr:hypothetical protein [Bdellovibrionales bacterium]